MRHLVTRHIERVYNSQTVALIYPLRQSIDVTPRWLAAAALGLCAGYAAVFAYLTPTSMPIVAAIFLASFASSVAGFAFSAICGAMLFHLVSNPVDAVQTMIVCSIFNQFYMVYHLRTHTEWRALPPFLIGGVLGLPVGIAILLHVDRHEYLRTIGGFLLIYGLIMLFRKPFRYRGQSAFLDALAGTLGGITGGGAGFPGAVVTIWCSTKGLDKNAQRGLYQPFILVMQIVAFFGISFAQGRAGLQSLHYLGYVPAALCGTAVGMLCFGCLNDRQFGRVVNAFIILSGIGLIA